MKKHQWVSKVVKARFRKNPRNLRRSIGRQALHFETLEQRNLLASVEFFSFGGGSLFFRSEAGRADIVNVSAPTEDSLQIQVGGGDSISLLRDAIDNNDFVLSQTVVTNDTLTINGANSIIEQLSFQLGDLDDVFTATGLAIVDAEFLFRESLQVFGDAGADIIDVSALAVPAAIFGGDGDDQLTGGSGGDLLAGGSGTDVIDGGAGFDTNSFFDVAFGVTATIAADGTGIAQYGPVSESFSGIEGLTGSNQDDVLTGNDSFNIIEGGLGNDIISGLGGDDSLLGGRLNEEATGFSLSVNNQPFSSLLTDQSPQDLVTEAANGNLYVNVQTFAFPNGEIGGQLLLESDTTVNGVRTLTLGASLDSAQAPDNASDSDATGQATVTIIADNGNTTYSLNLSVDGIRPNQLSDGSRSDLGRISIDNVLNGTNGSVFVDVIQDASGTVDGLVFATDPTTGDFIPLNPAADTGDGNVFVEIFPEDNNIINGGAGRDFIRGGTGNDTIDGGLGNDILAGLRGDDILHGGEGDDDLRGGIGDDTLNGDDGDDILTGEFGIDTINGGAGTDTNSFDQARLGVIASIGADGNGEASNDLGTESFFGIENLTGSNFDDILRGNDLANTIDGGIGNDTIFGAGGDDILFGGAEQTGFAVFTNQQTPPGQRTVANIVEEAIAGNLYISVNTNNGEIRAPLVLVFDDTFLGGDRQLFFNADFDSASGVTGGGTLQLIVSGTTVTFFSSVSITRGLQPDELLPTSNLSAIVIRNAAEGTTGPAVIDVINSAGGDINGNAMFPGSDTGDGDVFEAVLTDISGNFIFNSPNTTDDDIINGGLGNDTIRGGLGNDILRGGAGDDIAVGGVGDDSLNGGDGDDTLNGGRGDDFFVGIGGTDSIDGGQGIDTNSFQGIGSAVTATVDADGSGTASYGAVNETFFGIENLTGSPQNDVLSVQGSIGAILRGLGGDDLLTGSIGSDVLFGNDGNDILRSGRGADVIYGGEGNDSLNGGDGDDILQGNGGNDFFVGIGGADIIAGGVGFDTNSFQGVEEGAWAIINDDGTGQAQHGQNNESFTGIDRLVGSENDDNLTVGGSRGTQLIGLGGNDRLIGGSGDDVLIGGEGDDILNGLGGNDTIFGNLGNDRIHAGAGNDFVRGDQGNDFIAGGTGNDRLAGSEGDDQLFGSDGVDILFGGDGDDELFGGDNADELRGGFGDDLLNGGPFDDLLLGGAGNDREIQ